MKNPQYYNPNILWYNNTWCEEAAQGATGGLNLEMWGRAFLVVQWLRLHASNAEAAGLIPGEGTKVPHAAW